MASRADAWKGYLERHWRKIGVATAVGLLAGFLGGAVQSTASHRLDRTVYAAPMSAQPLASTHVVASAPIPVPHIAAPPAVVADRSAELVQLKQENQQLHALVEQLRKQAPAQRASTHYKKTRKRHRLLGERG